MDFKYLYTNWTGRARRKDYWLGTIILWVAIGVLVAIFGWLTSMMHMAGIGVFIYLVLVAVGAFGGAALAWKRMHDYGKSGWWLLIPVYGAIVAMFLPGTAGPNQFGPDPKGAAAAPAAA
jgi:uncharacterized membrane protein YhaH (DUF805 family)